MNTTKSSKKTLWLRGRSARLRTVIVVTCISALAQLSRIELHAAERRNQRERLKFVVETGHAGGWPGHVVDHKLPLCYGGLDASTNMQWETVELSKVKDRDENLLCRGRITLAAYCAKWHIGAPQFATQP